MFTNLSKHIQSMWQFLNPLFATESLQVLQNFYNRSILLSLLFIIIYVYNLHNRERKKERDRERQRDRERGGEGQQERDTEGEQERDTQRDRESKFVSFSLFLYCSLLNDFLIGKSIFKSGLTTTLVIFIVIIKFI